MLYVVVSKFIMNTLSISSVLPISIKLALRNIVLCSFYLNDSTVDLYSTSENQVMKISKKI